MNDDSNYIHIDKLNKRDFIYRIISLERLYQLFHDRENVLVNPSYWDDPYENIILKSTGVYENGEKFKFGMKDRIYGQCWSRHNASDAMWRLYSPNKCACSCRKCVECLENDPADKFAVRIRTRVDRLISGLCAEQKMFANMQCFIGSVQYLREKALDEFSKNIFRGVPLPQAVDVVSTLLVKRKAFVHEDEVRLLFYDIDGANKSDLFRYSVNPCAFIDQIMIDPCTTYQEYKLLEKNIREVTKFEGVIKRSLLCTPPGDLTIPFGG